MNARSSENRMDNIDGCFTDGVRGLGVSEAAPTFTAIRSHMNRLLMRTCGAPCVCFFLILGSTTAVYAQEARPMPGFAPIGVVNRNAFDVSSGGITNVSVGAPFSPTTESARELIPGAPIWDDRSQNARKRHMIIGALSGGILAGALAVVFVERCTGSHGGDIGPLCVDKGTVVAESAALGMAIGAIGGYVWPVKSGS